MVTTMPTPYVGTPDAVADNGPAALSARPALQASLVTILGRPPERTAAVVVEGAAGSGVTRTLSELARIGIGYGRVLHGMTSSPGSFSVLIQAFGGTELAEDLRVALSPAGVADPCRDQRLARVIADWISGVDDGVLLVLDDVHRADSASIALLVSLLRTSDLRGFTMLIGGRAGRLPSVLRAECLTTGISLVVPMQALPPDSVRELVPGCSRERSRLLCEASLGRPALIVALEKLSGNELRKLERLPVTILADYVARSAVGTWRSASDMAPTTRRVAAAAAVLGIELDADRIADVSGADTDQVLNALTELIEADLVEVEAGRLRFAHPVLRATAYRWIEPIARTALHRRAAEVLAMAGASPLDVADHLAIAAKPGDRAAAQSLVAAARRRLRTDAVAAVRWSEAAARLLTDPLDPVADDARCLLAQAQVCTGELARATELSHDLLARGAHAGRATLLLARCERLLGRPTLSRSMLIGEQAAAAGNEELAVEIDLELLAAEVALVSRTDVKELVSVSDEAVVATRDLLVLAGRALGPQADGVGGELRAHADQVAEAIDRLSNRALVSVVDHLGLLVWIELRLDRPDLAAAHAERALLVASGRDYTFAELLLARAAVALRQGDLNLVLDLTGEAAEYANRLGLTEMLANAEASALQAKLWTSGLTIAELGEPSGGRFPTLVRADVLRQLDRLDDAWECLLPLLAEPPRVGAVRAAERALAVTIAAASGHLSAAREHYTRARKAAPEASLFEAAEVDLAGAVLACGEARWAQACSLAVSAADQFQRLGAPVFAGRARLQAGEAYRLSGDLEAAGREIGAAKQIFQRHGADQLTTLAINAQKRTAASGSRRLGCGDFGLSAREAEIALLVCQGLTNRNIAHKLFLSVRTVDSHVARILSKVGVGSRVALVGTLAAESPGLAS